MYTHLIIIGSDFESGDRIGFHISSMIGSKSNSQFRRSIRPLMEALEDKSVSVAVHQVQTFDETWESVITLDPFFKDVIIVDTSFKFLHRLSSKKSLKAIDISMLILSKVTSTPLKLQKLLYLCYADYLLISDRKMFGEEIVAYQYGPVVEEIYQEFKGIRTELEIEDDVFLNINSNLDSIEEQSMLMARITSSPFGFEIYESCLSTLEKYGDLTARQLVDLTHKPNDPWDIALKREGRNATITDQIIREHHELILI